MSRAPARSLPAAIVRLVALAGLVLAGAVPAQDWDDKVCQKCHGDKKIVSMPESYRRAMVRGSDETHIRKREPGYLGRLHLPDGLTGVHAKVRCVECHRGITTIPHAQYLPAADGCRSCHEKEVGDFGKGCHATAKPAGKGLAPDCTTCHGRSHAMVPAKDPRSPVHRRNIPATCLACHTKEENPASARHTGARTVKSYRDSIHGRGLYKLGLVGSAVCTDCHGTHRILPEDHEDSLVHPQHIPATCGKCHQGLLDKYRNSIHYRKLAADDKHAPHCGICHTSHQIASTTDRSGFSRDTVARCGKCHQKELASYRASYHGKITKLGGSNVALCSDCHGHHSILPAEEEASLVSKKNLADTCRKCHTAAADQFALYYPHADHTDRERYPIVYWSWLLMTILLSGTLAFFLAHTILWMFRETIHLLFNREHEAHPAPGGEKRFIRRYSSWHRLTHLLVIVSFMGLVATGIPLKYSYTDWAQSLMHAFGGYQVAGFLHRFCAVLTGVYVVMHGFWLAYYYLKVRRRSIFSSLFGPNSMILRWKDVTDLFSHLRWFLFIGPRPKFDRWTYWDKADYWGEYWGVTVIGSTGLLLWFPDFFSRFLPGWIFNVAIVVHSIEALLAASIIFLVHFFNVHLRPSKFPLDTVIFTGAMPEAEFIEEHPLEYERLKRRGELDKYIVKPKSRRFRVATYLFGITAFAFGLFLMALIIKTEWRNFFG